MQHQMSFDGSPQPQPYQQPQYVGARYVIKGDIFNYISNKGLKFEENLLNATKFYLERCTTPDYTLDLKEFRLIKLSS